MKLLLSITFMFVMGAAISQSEQTTTTVLFAQCMFSITDQAEMDALQEEMNTNPYVEMVRLDYLTQRALILTHNLENLSDEEFTSWFAQFGSTVYCIQIGVRGIDTMNRYPFTTCQ
jgi:hypothetical protein